MRKSLVFAVLFSIAASASAHKVKCFAAADGGKIAGYAWMSGGVRPKNVPFKVFDSDGNSLLEGKTDGKGEFSFTPPKRCDCLIVVYAGPGHEGKFTIKAKELPGAGIETEGKVAGLSATPVGPDGEPAPKPGKRRAGERRDATSLEAAVERAVSSQIAPLRAELAEFEDRETLRDVFAGLGYIAGVAGAAFFFFGSKRKEDKT